LRIEGWWLRDHRPQRFPQTEEERKNAALRYGMRPEDYKTYDPLEYKQSVGDYPDLGIITFAHRDPNEFYTDKRFRRSWGEPVPFHYERYRPDRITYTGLENEETHDFKKVLLGVTIMVLIYGGFWYYGMHAPNKLYWKSPMMPKEYPYDFYRAWPWNDPRKFPIVNYSFEPEDHGDQKKHHH